MRAERYDWASIEIEYNKNDGNVQTNAEQSPSI